MKVALVTGSRHWTRYAPIMMKLLGYDLILHGGCPTGADKLAEEAAAELQIDSLILRAKWTQQGRPAGPMRNERMVLKARHLREQGNTVDCYAFPIGDSPGTRHCIRQLKAHGFAIDVLEGKLEHQDRIL